jgi:hypothetical protein
MPIIRLKEEVSSLGSLSPSWRDLRRSKDSATPHAAVLEFLQTKNEA